MIIDKRLPEKIRKSILALQEDDDFDKIYGSDKKLDELFDKCFNIEDELMSLQLMASRKNEC